MTSTKNRTKVASKASSKTTRSLLSKEDVDTMVKLIPRMCSIACFEEKNASPSTIRIRFGKLSKNSRADAKTFANILKRVRKSNVTATTKKAVNTRGR